MKTPKEFWPIHSQEKDLTHKLRERLIIQNARLIDSQNLQMLLISMKEINLEVCEKWIQNLKTTKKALTANKIKCRVYRVIWDQDLRHQITYKANKVIEMKCLHFIQW